MPDERRRSSLDERLGSTSSSQEAASRICVLGITRQCNSHCSYCSCWRGPQEDMPAALGLQVIEQASQVGFELIGFSGGEPLLHPNLDRLIEAASSAELWSTVTTNGILLSRARTRALRDAGLRGLVVSLDTLDPVLYRANRGVAIEHTLAGLDAALDERDSLVICVSAVLSADTLPTLHELAEFCLRQRIMLGVTPLHTEHGVIDTGEWAETSPAVIQEAFAALRDSVTRGLEMANTPDYLDALELLVLERQLSPGFTCRSPRDCMSVSPDGVVQVCPEAPPIGDLREHSLSTVWDSAAHRSTIEQATSGTCSGCWYSYRVEIVSIPTNEQ